MARQTRPMARASPGWFVTAMVLGIAGALLPIVLLVWDAWGLSAVLAGLVAAFLAWRASRPGATSVVALALEIIVLGAWLAGHPWLAGSGIAYLVGQTIVGLALILCALVPLLLPAPRPSGRAATRAAARRAGRSR